MPKQTNLRHSKLFYFDYERKIYENAIKPPFEGDNPRHSMKLFQQSQPCPLDDETYT